MVLDYRLVLELVLYSKITYQYIFYYHQYKYIPSVGAGVGSSVGAGVGLSVGAGVGLSVGAGVGSI